MNVIGDLLIGKSIEEIFDEGLNHINEDESVKEVLAKRIGEDILQYVDVETWGDEKPEVKVIKDEAYVFCFGRRMKPIVFYSCVFNNLGKVTKDLFISFSEDYEDLPA